MTEAEWLRCEDPLAMLAYLQGKTTERKFRLIACACCRLAWEVLTEEGHEAIEFIERFADGELGYEELDCAVGRANESVATCRQKTSWYCAGLAVRHAGDLGKDFGARPTSYVVEEAMNALERESAKDPTGHQSGLDALRQGVAGRVCGIVRDVAGSPFQSYRLDPAWLARNDATVRQIAASIYKGRSFDLMPVLADALEEAGCEDAALLAHCREPGPHVLGCWALDLILGRS